MRHEGATYANGQAPDQATTRPRAGAGSHQRTSQSQGTQASLETGHTEDYRLQPTTQLVGCQVRLTVSKPRKRGTDTGMSESEGESLRESNPNSAGPDTASGGMGVSSERTGDAGPFEGVTNGVKHEENPEGLDPKAGYPSLDPRSSGG